jgi:hypothetical protein
MYHLLHLMFYLSGIFIIFLLKKYSKNKHKGWYMWAVYFSVVCLGSMNYSRFLFGNDKILLFVLLTLLLVSVALIILRILVKKYIRTQDHQEDYLFFPLEPDNNIHSSDTKKASL